MSEYIKREDALNGLAETMLYKTNGDNEVAYMLRDLPSADVVEGRHGRWLRVGQSYIDPNKFLCFECSICGYTLDNHIKVELNYCPNCGAKMDGEEQDNE